jgi:hypothetical protein
VGAVRQQLTNEVIALPACKKVAVGVLYGDGVDGLLGLSFLSRFKISIDAQTVKIANRNGK